MDVGKDILKESPSSKHAHYVVAGGAAFADNSSLFCPFETIAKKAGRVPLYSVRLKFLTILELRFGLLTVDIARTGCKRNLCTQRKPRINFKNE
ncbi:hypothetical protein C5167_004173 [Papaver somniferum]|nr:hypothetical protein C5167_004173 [Papaver somniferum]